MASDTNVLYTHYHVITKDGHWRELLVRLSAHKDNAAEVERLLRIFPLRARLDELFSLYVKLNAEAPSMGPDGRVYDTEGAWTTCKPRVFPTLFDFVEFLAGYSHALNGLDGRRAAGLYMAF